MVITEYLERNARLWGNDIALVEVNPSEERDAATTWREASLVAEARPDAPYRRELSWRDFDRRANRFANLLLSRGTKRETKVAMLLMNCLEFLPIYFGILKAGCVVVPMNYRYSGEEIRYCLDLADVGILVFGPEAVMHFCLCNAWKYRYRATAKNGEEDLKKSDWYMRKYKELKEAGHDPT